MREIKKSRLAFLYFCILAAFLLIIGRMIFVVIIGDKGKVSGIYNPYKINKRANIFDRSGVLVATDLKTKSLYASSVLVKDPRVIAKKVSKIFPELSYNHILKKVISGKRNRKWILIRRNLTPNQVDQVKNLKLAGLVFEDDRTRVYPQKSIISHYVGYTDLDRKGLAGIERQYDKELISGENITLAMDIRIQDILYDELVNAMEEFDAKAAGGIIMNVNNGEVLALSSIPDFDPNQQNLASSKQRFNMVTSGSYEFGSVLKIFTNALAFEENLIKTTDKYDVSKPIKYGRFTIRDDHSYKDIMDVKEIFARSSNIGTVKIAEKIGIKEQKEFMEKIGFLSKIEADFPGLSRTIYPRIWREINLFTISYGHGIAITPLHLAQAVSAMVNGGILYKPKFIKSAENEHGKRVIKESTSALIRMLMRNTVTDGTGGKADVEGYEVGGKTGTAERAEAGSYNKKKTLASFVAAFPMSKPKYLIYIFFDRPNYTFNTGGMVAAPVAGRIIKNIAPLIDVKPLNVKNQI